MSECSVQLEVRDLGSGRIEHVFGLCPMKAVDGYTCEKPCGHGILTVNGPRMLTQHGKLDTILPASRKNTPIYRREALNTNVNVRLVLREASPPGSRQIQWGIQTQLLLANSKSGSILPHLRMSEERKLTHNMWLV